MGERRETKNGEKRIGEESKVKTVEDKVEISTGTKSQGSEEEGSDTEEGVGKQDDICEVEIIEISRACEAAEEGEWESEREARNGGKRIGEENKVKTVKDKEEINPRTKKQGSVQGGNDSEEGEGKQGDEVKKLLKLRESEGEARNGEKRIGEEIKVKTVKDKEEINPRTKNRGSVEGGSDSEEGEGKQDDEAKKLLTLLLQKIQKLEEDNRNMKKDLEKGKYKEAHKQLMEENRKLKIRIDELEEKLDVRATKVETEMEETRKMGEEVKEKVMEELSSEMEEIKSEVERKVV